MHNAQLSTDDVPHRHSSASMSPVKTRHAPFPSGALFRKGAFVDASRAVAAEQLGELGAAGGRKGPDYMTMFSATASSSTRKGGRTTKAPPPPKWIINARSTPGVPHGAYCNQYEGLLDKNSRHAHRSCGAARGGGPVGPGHEQHRENSRSREVAGTAQVAGAAHNEQGTAVDGLVSGGRRGS